MVPTHGINSVATGVITGAKSKERDASFFNLEVITQKNNELHNE